MSQAQSSVIPFVSIPNGAIFKVLKPEYVGTRLVKNDSTYEKTGTTFSLDLHSKKDCIFDLKAPCRIIKMPRPASNNAVRATSRKPQIQRPQQSMAQRLGAKFNVSTVGNK